MGNKLLQLIRFCPCCGSDIVVPHKDGSLLCIACGLNFSVTSRNSDVLKEEEEFDILEQDESYRYKILSRMKMDCDYYLGNGSRCEKNLWAENEVKQIENMKQLWNSFDLEKKPEWLTWEQILDYEKKMDH